MLTHAFDLLRFVDFSTIGRNCKAAGWTSIASEDVRRKVRSCFPHVALATRPLAFSRSYWFIQASRPSRVSLHEHVVVTRDSRSWNKNSRRSYNADNDAETRLCPPTRGEEPGPHVRVFRDDGVIKRNAVYDITDLMMKGPNHHCGRDKSDRSGDYISDGKKRAAAKLF